MSESNGTMTADSLDSAANIIADNTVVFCLKIRMIGNSKAIATKHAAKRRKGVSAGKTLLDCPEYESLTQKASEIRAYMRSHQVPNCEALLLQDSAFPVPLDMVEEVDQYLQKAIREFNVLHRQFIVAYPKRKQESFEALQQEQLSLNGTKLSVVSIEDFKTLEQVKCDISVEYRMVSFSTPTTLKDINIGLYRRESSKIVNAAREAADSTVAALRNMTREALDYLIDIMSPDADGKRKSLKEGPIEKYKKLFDDIQSLNVTKDVELNSWSKKCQSILKGVDVETLRDSDATRRMTGALLKQVKKQIDTAIVTAPSREIILDE